MADKKLTAAEKKAAVQEATAAAEAAAAAEETRRTTERKRLLGAGAVLAAVALFVGGFAVGKSSSTDDTLVGASVIQQDGPISRRGPGGDLPDRRGPEDRPEGRFPGGREFPRGDGFEGPFADGFEIPEGFSIPDGFEFGMECIDGECTFHVPEGFGLPGQPDSRPFPTDPRPGQEQPSARAGYLGVSVLDGPDGVIVAEVSPGSPASDAGIESGDVFVEVAGVPIASVDDLVGVIADAGAGTEVVIVITRGGSERSFDVVLGSPPA